MPEKRSHEMRVLLRTPQGELEGVPAVFNAEIEHLPAEDFAPADRDVSASLHHLRLNKLNIYKPQALSWLGPDVIRKLEELAAERLQEEPNDP